jgi:hypothetical protein
MMFYVCSKRPRAEELRAEAGTMACNLLGLPEAPRRAADPEATEALSA